MLITEHRRKASQNAEGHWARGLCVFGARALLLRFLPWEPRNCIPYADGVIWPAVHSMGGNHANPVRTLSRTVAQSQGAILHLAVTSNELAEHRISIAISSSTSL